MLPAAGDAALPATQAPLPALLALCERHGAWLVVDDAQLSPRVAFGSSTAFDAPIAGVVSLQYKTSPLRYLYLVLQALVWLCLLMLAANFSRFRRSIRQTEAKSVTLVSDSSRPEQKIDMASR